jgi:hypothetical protein
VGSNKLDQAQDQQKGGEKDHIALFALASPLEELMGS